MKRFAFAARALALIGVFSVSCAQAALPVKLNAATSGDLPPVSFVNAQNELDGYDVQVARFVSAYLHIPMQLDHLEFKGILPGLQTGRFDIVFSNVNITPERAAVFDYSIPYSRSAVVIVARSGANDIKSFKDLKGKRVGAIAGANDGEMPARDIEKQYGEFADFKGYSGYAEMFTDLAFGRLDAVVAPDTSAANVLRQRPGIASIVGEPYRVRFVGAPMPKGSADLKAGVDAAIREMKKEGLLDKWGKQYFGIDHYSAQLSETAK
ncbi:amino acid ABC transporter substrate-binding protein (PAAT family) [Paraburkholderia caballeronis]|uniref:substrate-binding periplasmic protein n=1 Tax=Paraburkholderia caballeronis TaxID=416943 RepID=UPI001066E3D7|nr:transporter substrate-binding domain-containing protein [Paraburkholderia caballeronis]TDV35569.1 amino acid ABC transporter substrate-binding protein (PAAT family) [Paraburkholderia caballeronis]